MLEAEEPFESGRQGSSSMPHKRNPARCERVSGLARVLRGFATVGLENVALWHERDISHSSAERIVLPDACIALDYMLHLFTGVMDGLRVLPENMRRNMDLSRGLYYSQRVLLALIDKGLERTAAYKIVQTHSMRAWTEGQDFKALLADDPHVQAHLSPEELDGLFDLGYHLKYIDHAFRRCGLLPPEEGASNGSPPNGAFGAQASPVAGSAGR